MDGREPIRAELFGPESLEAYARRLAEETRAPRFRAGGRLPRRFAENGRVLARAHRRITESARRGEPLTPDAEWLLDNYYIVEEVLREVEHDLPRGYYRELPKLTAGPMARFPRVAALAVAVVAHTDSSLDEAHLVLFVEAYQAVAPLTIGELWAVPIMLRLALLENLRRLAEQMLAAADDRKRAEEWAARHAAPSKQKCPPDLPKGPDLTDPFIVRALQVLRAHGPTAAVAQLERCLAERGEDPAAVVQRENRRQAVNQVSVGNCVTSLRLLEAVDWNAFFERVSGVEARLHEDPSGVYPLQDFATRDRCRQAVERLARRSGRTEEEVTRRALARAAAGAAGGAGSVAYHLIGDGLSAFQAALGYRPAAGERLRAAALAHPNLVFFGSIVSLTAVLLAGALLLAAACGGGAAAPWAWGLAAAAALLPASELAVAVVNYALTLFLPPRVLPKMELKEGVPPDCATFVVVPCMLLSPRSAADMIERLEVHYLANPDDHLYYALLTDLADAPSEVRPEDEGYLRAARDGVAELNRRYAEKEPRFFLFHRARRWNAAQGCWMGWERKRGKLGEFNRLLHGAGDTSFVYRSAGPADLPRVRFVITLDADTQLPREAARRLIGALAHPLNRPRFDPAAGRVVAGYGMLQPRVSFRLSAERRTVFSRLWAASAGVDPYSAAISDVYQDLFGAGTFTGKGIYDLEAFEAATGRTFPDNHILSHDLIEGNYARCGLVTDVEVFDDFPSRYHAYARREHRWVRGDWQLLPWLGRTVPAPSPLPLSPPGERGRGEGGRRTNPLPVLERWKIVDNLRRSLVPPALVLLLALGWTVLPGPAWLWSAAALAVLAAPLLLQLAGAVVQAVRGQSLSGVRALGRSLPATAGQTLLAAAFLADQARLTLDAAVRTLYRLYVSRRKRLEWETAAAAEARLGGGLRQFAATMWPAAALAVALGLLLALARPEALGAAAPFLVAWLLSPLAAWAVSRPPPTTQAPLSPAERRELRRVARRTWAFFEAFVGEADHWLPPDNFQEDPEPKVAHRTSPTNLGLYLVSTLAAQDLGYLGLGALAGRLEKTFDALGRLELYRGHFYNWYDTQALKALQPAYVSTVDSGNLLGCLVALKQGLREKAREPWPGPSLVEGLSDALEIAAGELRDAGAPNLERRLHAPLAAARAHLAGPAPATLPGWAAWLGRLRQAAHELEWALGDPAALPKTSGSLELWVRRFAGQARDAGDELAALAPWLELLDRPDAAAWSAALAGRAPEDAVGWESARRRMTAAASVAELAAARETLADGLSALKDRVKGEEKAGLADWLGELAAAARASSAADLRDRLARLAGRADALAAAMDFRFLYKPDRRLFSIGFHAGQGRLDAPCYDLLASEARLASFLAVARGDAPRRHWFQLGRLLTRAAGELCLVSWGGTMFEYLMPELLLPCYGGTLLAESRQAAVDRQMQYGRERGVPWGISESAYSGRYHAFDYQYQSFGVPGLGLKRGLGHDLVVAPYATALAATVRPRAALRNLRRLAAEGAAGEYGYYESIDYTPSRLPEGKRSLVVRCFMAHHQGMSLLALTNALLGNPMPRRFHAEPMVKATDLMLQERTPAAAAPVEAEEGAPPPVAVAEGAGLVSRRLTSPDTPGPRAHLLSNGRYAVMLTNAGGGFSRCRGLDVTRWREDYTRDCWGQFCYVRDLESGLLWSAGHQPVCRPPDDYEVLFSADKADFRRIDGGVLTHLEVAADPEKNAEVRRVAFANLRDEPRVLEVTSYAEVVLLPHAADLAHPAFGKLFLETEWLPTHHALLCRRRPRSAEQQPVWAVHVLAADGGADGEVEYETDRARFLGRGRTPADPAALEPGAALSGTVGPVLDPVFSLRRRVRLAPGASVALCFTTAVADSREEALALADHYRDPQSVLRAFELAWAHSQVELRHLQLSSGEAHLFQRLATSLLIAGPTLRAAPEALAANRQGVSGLWRHGVSGDRPIAVAVISDMDQLPLARQLLTAHAYWRLRGLEVDLVLLNERPTGYVEELQQALQDLIRTGEAHALADKPGGVFLRQSDQLPAEDRTLFLAAARVVLYGARGPLAEQLERGGLPPGGPADGSPPPADLPAAGPPKARQSPRPGGRRRDLPSGGRLPPLSDLPRPRDLLFANGLGGFTPDGREYVVRPEQATPAPWINVIANPNCGFLVSESGTGYTWTANSQANRLTPWNNDPVADPPGEVVYLRDEQTGSAWTPTPGPLGAGLPLRVRHGQGYTVFEQRAPGLAVELTLFVPPADSVKIYLLKVRNQGGRPRRLSAAFYAEWVLGTQRGQAPMRVLTETDAGGALLARSPFNEDFARWVAFADVSLRPRTLTADRTEFLGRNGSPADPAALRRVGLSGRVGAPLDPCAALHAAFDLAVGEEKEVVFVLGEADGPEAARKLAAEYRDPRRAEAALAEAKALWERVLGAVQVKTPDPALDLLVNRWLPYQVLSCRVWGRSALYQSGGAYGFRDQLQDVAALAYGAPAEARAHLLRAAGRQFVEGDVQHWWHPPAGRGVRTHFSDDFLWLPFVACHYVSVTGDYAVLDERAPFLTAPRVPPDQEDSYGLPDVSDETGTLYEHCVRALKNGLRFGSHGLPRMGGGDWNDGMNKVGAGGKGETVWGAWFLLTCLTRFAAVAERRGDAAWAAECRAAAEELRTAVEATAWDGRWYRRAYFDDGTPLGSAENDECQFDSLPQSWAVLSGAADAARAAEAMAAVDERLVRKDDQLILLFTPPFDHGKLQPGYIKGYLPGIRENGGQYTHAATWVVLAAALQGRGDRAGELFDILNPIRHAMTPEAAARYRVEPYVVAADVYGAPPHTGRGGWTWYTGSAAWLYRAALEAMLGFRVRGDALEMAPCVPRRWRKFELTYRRGSTGYHVTVVNPDGVERGVKEVSLDGQALGGTAVPLADDGGRHEVRVVMG
jgi:cyclic beta-1,2-glucan synthetase